MPNLKVTVKEFDKALRLLNDKLIEADKVMTIKAIGGEAMMRAGLRDADGVQGFSEDIDNIAARFDDTEILMIESVGKDLNLLPDWLNTDPIDLPEVYEVIDQLTWMEDKNYSNIRLYIADIPSLILLKTRAIEGGSLLPRKTDKNDLIKLLKKVNIHNVEDLEMNKNVSFIKEYSRCYSYLQERGEW